MTHKPENQADIERLATERVKEVLSNLKKVVPVYIEPNDVIFIEVSKNLTQEQMQIMQRSLQNMFPDNQCVMHQEGVVKDIKVLKNENSVQE